MSQVLVVLGRKRRLRGIKSPALSSRHNLYRLIETSLRSTACSVMNNSLKPAFGRLFLHLRY
ncbi:hypothetical protein HMPREF1988_00270 [Porphyromonas gingivalis F0185]|nr:hypothetical protein HMPREF1988_00270 [Porphyromonas gingivalis F0185]